MKTPQEIFDYIATHLLKQGAKSVDGVGEYAGDFCMYRGVDGHMCAVGCLIKDDHYDPDLENHPVDNPYVKSALCKSLGVDLEGYDSPLERLLISLQVTHDSTKPETWSEQLRLVAEKFDLKFNLKMYEDKTECKIL